MPNKERDSQRVQEEFHEELERIAKAKADFLEKFSADAEYALSWSNDLFQVAAREKVLNIVLRDLESGKTIEELVELLREMVTDQARRPSFSTSVTSNLSDTYKLQAFAEALQKLEIYNRRNL